MRTAQQNEQRIALKEIVEISSEGKNLWLTRRVSDGSLQGQAVFMSLAEIEERLPVEDFVRVHKTRIVGLAHVENYQSNGKDGMGFFAVTKKSFTISRTYLAVFRERWAGKKKKTRSTGKPSKS